MQIVKWWIVWGLSRKSIFQELHLTVCLHVMWGGDTRSDMEKVECYINTIWHEASCRCWLLIVSLCICMMDSRYFSTRLLCSLHLSHFVEQCVWETLKCSASLKDSAKVLEKLLAVKPSWVKLLVGRRSIQQAEQFCCLTAAGKPQIHVTLHHHELWRPVMETDRLYMCVYAPLFRGLHC